MTGHPGEYPRSGVPTGSSRALAAGSGSRLRTFYLTMLLLSVVALALLLPFPWYLAATSIGEADLHVVGAGALVATVSAVLLLGALLTGWAAVRGDQVSVATARRSARLAGIGALTGWIGAVLTFLIGVVLSFADVDLALLQGGVLAGLALVPALLNDKTKVMSANAAGDRNPPS